MPSKQVSIMVGGERIDIKPSAAKIPVGGLSYDTPFEIAAMEKRAADRKRAVGLPDDATNEALQLAEGTLPYGAQLVDSTNYRGHAPATWERTVLPALRRAMTEHPELRGARVKLETTDTAAPTFEVKLSGEGWDYTAHVRRDSVTHVECDCAGLAMEITFCDVQSGRQDGPSPRTLRLHRPGR